MLRSFRIQVIGLSLRLASALSEDWLRNRGWLAGSKLARYSAAVHFSDRRWFVTEINTNLLEHVVNPALFCNGRCHLRNNRERLFLPWVSIANASGVWPRTPLRSGSYATMLSTRGGAHRPYSLSHLGEGVIHGQPQSYFRKRAHDEAYGLGSRLG